MRAKDLDLRELLAFEPGGGVIRFGDQRVLRFDAAAPGILRRELLDGLGPTVARGLLTRFGSAHGRRMAESLRTGFPLGSGEEWRLAGGRLHMLQGLLVVEPVDRPWPDGTTSFVESIRHESHEAEQHLLHVGRAGEPVCWTLAGFASGSVLTATSSRLDDPPAAPAWSGPPPRPPSR